MKLTISYAGFLMLAGGVLLAAVWVFLLRNRRYGEIRTLDQLLPDLSLVVASQFGPRVFIPAAGLVMVFLLVFGVVGGWVLAGWMLAPLTRITEATRRATAGSLSHRIELAGRRDEFRALADDFDSMLARLEAHVAEQRRFAANASHELRTPLAITRTLLDVARTDADHDSGELVDRLHATNTRAIELTEALLLLARSDRGSFTRERVDLSLVIEEAMETLQPLADKHGVDLEARATGSDGDPVTVGSPALLLQLVTNLVHNAIVHNLPARGEVLIRTSTGDLGVALTVDNTGELLSPQLVSTLTEPFRRGTDRVRSDHAGVGLGLAIVESIARAHDGDLILRARAGGGLSARVWLPQAFDEEDRRGIAADRERGGFRRSEP